jgi:hypothetical protein
VIAAGASFAVLRDRAAPSAPSIAARTAAVATIGSAPLNPAAATRGVASSVAPTRANPDEPTTTPKVIARVAQVAPGELAVNAGISDLSDDQLRSLIGSLDRIEAVPDAEPDPNPVQLPNDPGAMP